MCSRARARAPPPAPRAGAPRAPPHTPGRARRACARARAPRADTHTHSLSLCVSSCVRSALICVYARPPQRYLAIYLASYQKFYCSGDLISFCVRTPHIWLI